MVYIIVRELVRVDEVEYAKLCIKMCDIRIYPYFWSGCRCFGLFIDNYMCATVCIQSLSRFSGLMSILHAALGLSRSSYVVLGVCNCCPGDYVVKLLTMLPEKLREEGVEALVGIAYTRERDRVFREAGFQHALDTDDLKPVYVKKLK